MWDPHVGDDPPPPGDRAPLLLRRDSHAEFRSFPGLRRVRRARIVRYVLPRPGVELSASGWGRRRRSGGEVGGPAVDSAPGSGGRQPAGLARERQALEQVGPRPARRPARRRHVICIVDGRQARHGTRDYVRRPRRPASRSCLLERPKPGPGLPSGDASRAGLEWPGRQHGSTVFVDLDARLAAAGGAEPRGVAGGVAAVRTSSWRPSTSGRRGARTARREALSASFVYNALVRLVAGTACATTATRTASTNRRAAELALSFAPLHTGPFYMLEMLAPLGGPGLAIIEVPTRYGPRSGATPRYKRRPGSRGSSAAVRVAAAFSWPTFDGDAPDRLQKLARAPSAPSPR